MSSLKSISSTVCGQLDAHDPADFISVMSTEMFIDATFVLMESSMIKEAVISSITKVSNLSGLAFLYTGGYNEKLSLNFPLR